MGQVTYLSAEELSSFNSETTRTLTVPDEENVQLLLYICAYKVADNCSISPKCDGNSMPWEVAFGDNIGADDYFYGVHSYYPLTPNDEIDITFTGSVLTNGYNIPVWVSNAGKDSTGYGVLCSSQAQDSFNPSSPYDFDLVLEGRSTDICVGIGATDAFGRTMTIDSDGTLISTVSIGGSIFYAFYEPSVEGITTIEGHLSGAPGANINLLRAVSVLCPREPVSKGLIF